MCRYCGAKSPEVSLHIDHIVAVSAGGDNSIENLVTSCMDCNLGKSAKPILEMEPLDDSARSERVKSLLSISSDGVAKLRRVGEIFDFLLDAWFSRECLHSDDWGDEYHDSVRDKDLDDAFRQFPKRLKISEIVEAMDVAFERFPPERAGERRWDADKRFRYFCGVCWKKIRTAEEMASVNAATAIA